MIVELMSALLCKQSFSLDQSRASMPLSCCAQGGVRASPYLSAEHMLMSAATCAGEATQPAPEAGRSTNASPQQACICLLSTG